ncbi:hypothetical protein LIPSTDRAFT_334885, partial [Lipomyces starkeyi NRRL Y-11557]
MAQPTDGRDYGQASRAPSDIWRQSGSSSKHREPEISRTDETCRTTTPLHKGTNDRKISTKWIDTHNMVADGLTKSLERIKFGDFVTMLGMGN